MYHVQWLLFLTLGIAVAGCVAMPEGTPLADPHICRDSCTKGGAVAFHSCCLERENYTCVKRGTLSSQYWFCGQCGKWCASDSTACQ